MTSAPDFTTVTVVVGVCASASAQTAVANSAEFKTVENFIIRYYLKRSIFFFFSSILELIDKPNMGNCSIKVVTKEFRNGLSLRGGYEQNRVEQEEKNMQFSKNLWLEIE